MQSSEFIKSMYLGSNLKKIKLKLNSVKKRLVINVDGSFIFSGWENPLSLNHITL